MGLPARDILAAAKISLVHRDFDFEQLDPDRIVINLHGTSTHAEHGAKAIPEFLYSLITVLCKLVIADRATKSSNRPIRCSHDRASDLIGKETRVYRVEVRSLIPIRRKRASVILDKFFSM